ncbi:hypothetical protein SK128_028139 [Halocaridina rubra]|uniref:Uncharacterized protein n=1 Tax=Halocaridina rubra TaxID=373956 RepID=A0AAN9A100_HALRR
MKEPFLEVTSEPQLVIHVPDILREPRTLDLEAGSSKEGFHEATTGYTDSRENAKSLDLSPGILIAEKATSKSVINDEFIHEFLHNVSGWHGLIRKATESLEKGTKQHYTGIERPKALLPPGQKRRKRVHINPFNRTKTHVSSNPHIFAREGGDMAFGLKENRKKSSEDMAKDALTGTRGKTLFTTEPLRIPSTFAPLIYKPGPALVKIAPNLEDLKNVGLINDREYERMRKDPSLMHATPAEIMKKKEELAEEMPESEIKIPNYIVTTRRPKLVYKNIRDRQKVKDDYMALYVETEYNPTYSVPPQALHSFGYKAPQQDFRKYNISGGETQSHLLQSPLSVAVVSPSYFSSLSPTASSFIPPTPAPSFSQAIPGPPPKVHHPIHKPHPSPQPSTPRHVYQPPRTYTLSNHSPKPFSRIQVASPPSPQPSRPPAYTLTPGKAFMPPVVKFTTFQPSSKQNKNAILTQPESRPGDLSNEDDLEDHLSYPPGIFTPITPTTPPPSSEPQHAPGINNPIQGLHRDSISIQRDAAPKLPQPNHHLNQPQAFESIYRPPFPHSTPYPPQYPTHTPTPISYPTHSPTPQSPPTIHQTTRPIPTTPSSATPYPRPSLTPQSPPAIHQTTRPIPTTPSSATPYPRPPTPKTYHLTTSKPFPPRETIPPRPTKLPYTTERRDKTLLNYNHRYWKPKQSHEYPSDDKNIFHKTPNRVFVIPDHLHNARPQAGTPPPIGLFNYPTPKIIRKPLPKSPFQGPIRNEN